MAQRRTMPSLSAPPPYKNRVLASLPVDDMNRLAPHLSPVTLNINRSLYDPGQTIDTVYFLEDGVCSVVITMENGRTVEVGVIGRDGFVGLAGVLGTGRSPYRTFIQIPGHGYSVKAKVLQELFEASSEFRLRLQRFVQAMLVQTAQTAACNRVHELEERLARWLLMCQDRVQSDRIAITHEFLAMMLGTRRTSVTVAAGMLHKAGLIAYSRGHVTIQNRERLEQAACECHRIIHEEYVRLGLL
jgi:CRP-like cAMP-binding protein